MVLIFVLRGAGQAPLPPSPATSTAADGEGCGLWVWGMLLNPTLSTAELSGGEKWAFTVRQELLVGGRFLN